MTLTYLDFWLKKLENIIIDINISLNNAKRLCSETDSEEIMSIKKDPFFQHLFYQIRFILIIQLAKLFQKGGSHKITFLKLINRLSSEVYDQALNNKLKENAGSGETHLFKCKDDIKKTREEIIQLLGENSRLISKIENARDKVYAHSDPDVRVSYLKIDELKKLTMLANDIYNIINGRFYNSTTMFEITSSWNIGIFLSLIAQKGENKTSK